MMHSSSQPSQVSPDQCQAAALALRCGSLEGSSVPATRPYLLPPPVLFALIFAVVIVLLLHHFLLMHIVVIVVLRVGVGGTALALLLVLTHLLSLEL